MTTLPDPAGYGAPGTGFVDPSAAIHFLQLLGKDPARTWFRTFFGKRGSGRHPRDGKDLPGFDVATLAAENLAGLAVYFIPGYAEQATGVSKKTGKPTGAVIDDDILHCPSIYYEHDDRPQDWQLTSWREFGLPEPTVQVDTGGKSIHHHWVFDQPITPEQFRNFQQRLALLTGGDSSIQNPSRVMRLPGFRYIDKATGAISDLATMVGGCGRRYDPAELDAIIPPLPAPAEPLPAPLLLPIAAPSSNGTTRSVSTARDRERVLEQLSRIPQRIPSSAMSRGQVSPTAGTRDIYFTLLGTLIPHLGRDGAAAAMISHSPQWAAADDLYEAAANVRTDMDPAAFFSWVQKHWPGAIPTTTSSNGHRPTGNGTGQAACSPVIQTGTRGPGQAPPPAAHAAPEDEEDAAADRAEHVAEIESFQQVEECARSVTPERLFPPGLARYIGAYAEEQQLAVRGFYLPILCAAASVIGNRAISVPQLDDELVGVAILWGMNIGSVSAGKSPTTKPTIEASLVPWHIEERTKNAKAIRAWTQRKKQAEEKAKGDCPGEDPMAKFLEEDPQPERRHIVATDITAEKLEINLGSSATPGLLVFHDEMGRWFSQLCRNPEKNDRPFWLSLRNGSAVLTDRVNREDVAIARPACSVFGNLQPKRVEGLWRADLKANDGHGDGDGLWARFSFITLPEWDYTYRRTTVKLAPVLSALYRQIDQAAAALPPTADGKAYQIQLADEALVLFDQWTHDLLAMRKARVHDEDRGFIDKQRGVTLTLALLLHAIRCTSGGLPMATPIPAETLRSAVLLNCLLIVERDQVMAPLRQGERTSDAKRLLAHGRKWREEHGDDPVPLKQLRAWRLPKRDMPAEERRGWLVALVGDTPGLGQVVQTDRSIEWLPPA